MSDIVERLRKPKIMTHAAEIGADVTLTEAADEIERLRADHIGAHRISVDTIKHLEAEIERLRAWAEDEQQKVYDAICAALEGKP